ncbi:MAG: tetratricopeptide repeat protein [Planctomycetaceae bacterium]|nr:tetratricopeptide repeat protein [Planctomycetaceae bacterium]
MLNGKTIYFLGKLKALNRTEASKAVRVYGGEVVRELSAVVDIVVVGEGDILSCNWNLWNDQLDAATKEAFEAGRLEIISEAFFWYKYGGGQTVETSDLTKSLFTTSMLSEITKLPLPIVRQLERRQLIIPTKQIHQLGYYNTESVLMLRIVRNMLDAGISPIHATNMLQKIKHNTTDNQLYNAADVQFNGRELFIVTKNGAVDLSGQHLFNFVADSRQTEIDPNTRTQTTPNQTLPNQTTADQTTISQTVTSQTPTEQATVNDAEFLPLSVLDGIFDGGTLQYQLQGLYDEAWRAELSGDLGLAIETYRTIIAVGGSTPQLNFQIAELLYRRGELAAARERYFAALEQDEEFVEARANLGCVLAELGEDQLAIAAFQGALKYHPDYAEVHFHLGMLLKRVGLICDAVEHLQLFVDLMPDSPWATKAHEIIHDAENLTESV